ncbi:hypothetical protein, partial [Aromatoleum aromaticum]|uniref:hypothetical protein n=1 Tax=Aromatoleum aromaticum TaxID=551760 RepID=UPI001B7CFBC6
MRNSFHSPLLARQLITVRAEVVEALAAPFDRLSRNSNFRILIQWVKNVQRGTIGIMVEREQPAARGSGRAPGR